MIRTLSILACYWAGEINSKVNLMKAEIHPKYEEITATCSCGNVIKTRSTVCEDIHLEVCSECHPFYTGKQKMIDTAGRIDRFNKRFGARGNSK
jgi:large subunit ribosomal protein L31